MSRLPVAGERESIPDVVIWDEETGYAINIPLAYQDNVTPEIEERIHRLRKEAGIVVAEPAKASAPATPIKITSSGRRQPRRKS